MLQPNPVIKGNKFIIPGSQEELDIDELQKQYEIIDAKYRELQAELVLEKDNLLPEDDRLAQYMQLQEQRKYLGDILAFVEENQGGNGNAGGEDSKP